MPGLIPRLRRSARLICITATLAATLGGCVAGQAFPMRSVDWRAVPVSYVDSASPSPRLWLERAHRTLAKFLPDDEPDALLTADLTKGDGEVTDVAAHFGIDLAQRRSIFHNPRGLLQSMQALQDGATEDAWSEFTDVEIPVSDHFALSARLGIAERNGRPVAADCIVIISGLLADNSLVRTRDLCRALRASGLHTLAIEPRGYGRTLARHPEVGSTFGILETADLIAVADWAEHKPFVRRTGLIGFCWGANEAMLAAWELGRDADDPDVAPRLRERVGRPLFRSHFAAGVMAFSPVLRFEEIVEQLDHRVSPLSDPVLTSLGRGIHTLMKQRGYARLSHSLRTFFEREAARSEVFYPGFIADGLRYLRFLPYRNEPVGPKLESVPVPLLIVQAASDPLGSAQDVADLFSGLSNPRVAALILPGGGHNGFAAYNRSYYYSLILNYFDANRGAAAPALPPSVASKVAALSR